MSDGKIDRRVQRTRALLRQALTQLIDEKGYDAITIQDITERANLGRTTFYLHYESKDALLLDHHVDFASRLMLRTLSSAELLDDSPPVEFEQFLEALVKDKGFYLAIARAKDAELILRGIRQQMEDQLVASLQTAFPSGEPLFAFSTLASYLVGAQLDFIDWWITSRNDLKAGDVARMLHRLQRAAVREALGVSS